MQSQSLTVDNLFAQYDEDNTYDHSLDDNISSNWDDLKDCLYMYSICAHQQLKMYEAEAIGLTRAFHSHLEYLPKFTYNLQISKQQNRNSNPWFWQNIMQDHYMQAGLMSVYEDYTTPLHDYNDLAVISYVLEGQIKLTRYQDQPAVISPYYPIAKLVKTQKQYLTAGDVVITSPDSGNISEIQSLTKKSIILNIHLIKNSTELGAWYFPISPKPIDNHEIFFAQRIRRSM